MPYFFIKSHWSACKKIPVWCHCYWRVFNCNMQFHWKKIGLLCLLHNYIFMKTKFCQSNCPRHVWSVMEESTVVADDDKQRTVPLSDRLAMYVWAVWREASSAGKIWREASSAGKMAESGDSNSTSCLHDSQLSQISQVSLARLAALADITGEPSMTRNSHRYHRWA